MKILLTVHQFVPEWTTGTEILTFSVSKELLRRGHHVVVFTGFPSEKNEKAVFSFTLTSILALPGLEPIAATQMNVAHLFEIFDGTASVSHST